MNLSNLKPAEGSTKTRKRIGRGAGSGDVYKRQVLLWFVQLVTLLS